MLGYLALLGSANCLPPPAGSVVAWGYNTLGQAEGAPPTETATRLLKVVGEPITDAVAVSAGLAHALVLKSDGTVAGIGFNFYGQATGLSEASAAPTNGIVTVSGSALREVVAVAAGEQFSLALKRDGSLVAWGANHVPPGMSNITAVAASGIYSLALTRPGKVIGWGSQPWASISVPESATNALAIAVGGGGNLVRQEALRRDGTVMIWGTGIESVQPAPAGLTDATAIAAGGAFSLALKRDGTVFGWGFNRYGQATGVPTSSEPHEGAGLVKVRGVTLTNVIAIAAWGDYALALKADGTVTAWGNERSFKPVPDGLNNVVAVAAGEGFCLAVTANLNPQTIPR
jgi:alpha-tubulin suppressor-like RCC1 family protein